MISRSRTGNPGHWLGSFRDVHNVYMVASRRTEQGVDHLDLYYQYRVDPDVPVEETWVALAGLVRTGKVRTLGNFDAHLAGVDRILEIAEHKSISAPQLTLSRQHASRPCRAVIELLGYRHEGSSVASG